MADLLTGESRAPGGAATGTSPVSHPAGRSAGASDPDLPEPVPRIRDSTTIGEDVVLDDFCGMELGVPDQSLDSRLQAGSSSYRISTETSSLSTSDLSRLSSNPSEHAPHDESSSQRLTAGSADSMARQMALMQMRASVARDNMAEDIGRLASSAGGRESFSVFAARVEAVETTIRNIEARVSSALESVRLAHRAHSDRASMGHDVRRGNAQNLLTPQAFLDAEVSAIESALSSGTDGTGDLVPGTSTSPFASLPHDRSEDYVPPALRSEPLVNDAVAASASLQRTPAREGSAGDETRGERLGLAEASWAGVTGGDFGCAYWSEDPSGSLGRPSESGERRFVSPLHASSAAAATDLVESCPSVRVSSTPPRLREVPQPSQGDQDTAIVDDTDGDYRRERAFASSFSTVHINPVAPDGLSTPAMDATSPDERNTTANGVVEGRFELRPVWIDGWQHPLHQADVVVSGATNTSRVHDSPGRVSSRREVWARISAARRRLRPGGSTRGPRTNMLRDTSAFAEHAEGSEQYPVPAGSDEDVELELQRNPAMLRARDDALRVREWLTTLWSSNRLSEASSSGDSSRSVATRGTSLPLSRRPRDEAQRGGRVILEAGDRVEHIGRLRQHSTSALNALRRVMTRLRRGEETLRNATQDSRRPASRQGHVRLSSRGAAGQNSNLERNATGVREQGMWYLTPGSLPSGEAMDGPDELLGHPAHDGDQAGVEEGGRSTGRARIPRSATVSVWAAEGRNPRRAGTHASRNAVLRRRAWLRQELERFRERQNENLIRLLRVQQDHLRVRLRQVSTLSDIVDSVTSTAGAALPSSRVENSSIDSLVTEILDILRNLLELLPTAPQSGTGAALDSTPPPGRTGDLLGGSADSGPTSPPSELAVSAVIEAIAVALQSACRMIDITSMLGANQRADVSRRVMEAVMEALPRLDSAISAISGRGAPDSDAHGFPASERLGPEAREGRRTYLEAITASFPETSSPSSGGGPSDCVICLSEACEGEGLCRLPCDHVFHRLCIAKWLRIQPSCPTCRQDVPAARRSRVLRSLWGERESYGGTRPPSDGEA